MASGNPNLRHRGRHANELTGSEEGLPLLGERRASSIQQVEVSTSDNNATTGVDSSSLGYKLEPLVERSILMRLDVGPVLLIYSILIPLDRIQEQRMLFLDYLFPLVLLGQLTLFFTQQWKVRVRARVGFQTAPTISQMTHCLVGALHGADKHDSAHDNGVVAATSTADGVMIVRFRDIVFRSPMTTTAQDADVALWTMEENDEDARSATSQTIMTTSMQSFHRLRYPIHLPLEFYEAWTGFHEMSKLLLAQQVYGSNTTPIELPPFITLLQEQVVAPFFLFQVLCVILWSLDEYWYYAIFTFLALLTFESTVAYNRLQSLRRLRAHTGNQQRPIFVYRPGYPPGENRWTRILVSELVPGDIVCLERLSFKQRGRGATRTHQQEQQLNRIPADILILSGDAVVDEALLTGESIPQLKGALGESSSGGTLDLHEHKESILFGGTTLLVGNPGTSVHQIPPSPSGGVIGMVLRTGFETAQGSLLRTMAHTQKSVDGIHTKDTYVFIFLLLCCAVASAWMVFQEGWADPTRNRFRLLLHVIIIITSVVPPELPMELSLAVTNSVASLVRECQVYCTEVFRIPLAGQVSICCFDKTGTLTSDEMQLAGVRHLDADGRFQDVVKPEHGLPWPVERIMVACHSLALNGIPDSSKKEYDNLIGDPLEKAVLKKTGYNLIQNNVMRVDQSSADGTSTYRPSNILVLHRFRFSSKLKRMSVLVREDANSTTWLLTKGAPETIKTLLDPTTLPFNYDEISSEHMSMGHRVLALAYREVRKDEYTLSKTSQEGLDRQTIENGLRFAGFLLLDCPVKPDSKPVITELSNTGHKCYMITGDALLTAASVARQVGIIPSGGTGLYQLEKKHFEDDNTQPGISCFGFTHLPCSASSADPSLLKQPLSAHSVQAARELVVSGRIAICLSGQVLDEIGRALLQDQKDVVVGNAEQILFHPYVQAFLKELVPSISVFARHAPRQKEAVIAAFNEAGFKTLMCGDGTNDVGALRRAHVGISLISAPEVEAKQRAATAALSEERMKAKKSKKDGKKQAKSSTFHNSLRQLQEAQEELENVELGDASIASPFTSRTVSIKCCKDVLQQGRCTLVTMIQIYKILGVNCLVNATVLSKLFLHGVKNGDRQMTFLGLGVAALFFFVTRGNPLRTLSINRPPASVMCIEVLLSIALQFFVHLSAILLSAQAALAFVDPYDPSMIPDGPFNPNTLNSCTFLLSAVATVNTFAINYRGEPFMEPIWQNKLLLRSLQLCYAFLFGSALEVFPPLNDLLQLTEMPVLDGTFLILDGKENNAVQTILHSLIKTMGFPGFLCGLMILDTGVAFAAERTVRWVFEPR